MEYVILGLLCIQSMTVYELNKSFEQGIALFYSASLGSLQTALKKLLEKEAVVFEMTETGGRQKKIYTITPSGKAAFFEWMSAEIPPNKLEVTMLSKLFFMGMIEEKVHRLAIMNHMLTQTENALAELSETQVTLDHLKVPESFTSIFHYQKKTLHYGVHAHVFAVEWLKQLMREEEELKS